jgi:hypothetical protein
MKLLKIFYVTMICAFFMGCGRSESEELEAIIILDMNTSREGVLSNGRRFVFYGADQVSVTLGQFLDEKGLIYRHLENFVVQEETIEEMLERPEWEYHFSIGNLRPEWADIIVYYFVESNDVLFRVERDNNYAYLLGPNHAYVVNHESGLVTYYDEGWRH